MNHIHYTLYKIKYYTVCEIRIESYYVLFSQHFAPTCKVKKRSYSKFTSPERRVPLYTRPKPPFPMKFSSLNDFVAASISLRVKTDDPWRLFAGRFCSSSCQNSTGFIQLYEEKAMKSLGWMHYKVRPDPVICSSSVCSMQKPSQRAL